MQIQIDLPQLGTVLLKSFNNQPNIVVKAHSS